MILAAILALFSSFAWAQNSIVYSLAGNRVGSKTVVNIRLWIAIPFSIILNLIFLGKIFPNKHQLDFYIFSILSGIFGFFIADMLIFESFVLIGPRNTLITLMLTPVFNIIAGLVIFHDNLNIIQFIGSFVVILGLIGTIYFDNSEIDHYKNKFGNKAKYKINNDKNETNLFKKNNYKKKIKGYFFAILGALIQSLGVVFAKYSLKEDINPVETNFFRLLGGFIGINLFSFFKGELKNDFLKMKDLKSLFYISFGALVGPVLGVSATMYAIKVISISLTSILNNLAPIIIIPLEYLIFKKRTPIVVLIFVILVISGVILIFV